MVNTSPQAHTSDPSVPDPCAVSYDPMSPEVLADPFDAYAELHERCPVHRQDLGGGEALWTAARHADVALVARDHERFTAVTGQGPRPTPRVALFDDPPGHTRLRRVVQAAFGPRRIEALGAPIATLTDELLDAVADADVWDLHDALAEPLAVIVIARVLGVPESERAIFKHWSDEVLAGFNDPARGTAERRALQDFFTDEVQRRRQATDPPDDLTTVLSLTADDGGELLDMGELWSILVQLLIGGNETTTSLITNLVWRLLERRTLFEAVCADPALVPVAVEESLRHDPPVLGLYRQASGDQQLSGVEVPDRSRVMMCYGAANRDPTVFDTPAEFRLDRDPAELRSHLAFGAGPHLCVGAALARLEARVALGRLTERFGDLCLGEHHGRIETYLLWGRRPLEVRRGLD